MTQQLLLTYLQNQKEIFFANYKNAVKTADIEAIHDMRVSLKRLNTLVKLLNCSKKANFRLKSAAEPLRSLFKKTGRIRDFQIFSELLTTYQNENQYDNTLLIANCNNNEKKLTQLFYDSIQLSDYLGLKRNFNNIHSHIKLKNDDEIALQSDLFKKESEARVVRFSDPSNVNYNLHSTRKAIKDMSYLQEMLGKSELANDDQLVKYKEVGRLLGDWHDKSILYNYLVSNEYKLFLGIEHFDDLLDKLKTERDEMKNRFHSLSA